MVADRPTFGRVRRADLQADLRRSSELTLKGMALATRLKEKDAWDIYYCVRWAPRGNSV